MIRGGGRMKINLKPLYESKGSIRFKKIESEIKGELLNKIKDATIDKPYFYQGNLGTVIRFYYNDNKKLIVTHYTSYTVFEES